MVSATTHKRIRTIGGVSTLALAAALAGGTQNAVRSYLRTPVPDNVARYVDGLSEFAETLRANGVSIIWPREEVILLKGILTSKPPQAVIRVTVPSGRSTVRMPLGEYLEKYRPKLSSHLLNRLDELTRQYKRIEPDLKKFRTQCDSEFVRGARRGAAWGAALATATAGTAIVLRTARRNNAVRSWERGIERRKNPNRRNRGL